MDVFGNMNFQIISISDAANSKSVLSLFAARFSFCVKPFSSDHIEDAVLKAAYTKACHTPPTYFLLYVIVLLKSPSVTWGFFNYIYRSKV